ncbi:MAG TPA: hypothetical protein VNI01_09355 [Elusimicrobiota bacterium]|nr:hypothetical protein [Elusimicrobiota bacterium]
MKSKRLLSATTAAGVLVLPKALFGHCIFHLLGVSALLGFDPLHLLAKALLG